VTGDMGRRGRFIWDEGDDLYGTKGTIYMGRRGRFIWDEGGDFAFQ